MKFFEKYRLPISVGIALILSVLALLIWKYNKDRLEVSLAGKVMDTGKLLTQQFEGILHDNVGRLGNLKHRLEITNGDYFEYWNRDAARIVEMENTFKFVEWIDSSMVVQRVITRKLLAWIFLFWITEIRTGGRRAQIRFLI